MIKKALIFFIILILPTFSQAKYSFRYMQEQKKKEEKQNHVHKIPEKEFYCDADCMKIRKMFFPDLIKQ